MDEDDKAELGYLYGGHKSCKGGPQKNLGGDAYDKLWKLSRMHNFIKIYMLQVSNYFNLFKLVFTH